MLILLRSHDKYTEFAELDSRSGIVRWFTMAVPKVASKRIDGHVARLGGSVLCLYRDPDGMLHFRLDDHDLVLDHATVIDLERAEQNNLVIRRADGVLLTWRYPPPALDPPLDEDPTPFVEEEDFDFGLFLHNVTHDDVRRQTIYRG